MLALIYLLFPGSGKALSFNARVSASLASSVLLTNWLTVSSLKLLRKQQSS